MKELKLYQINELYFSARFDTISNIHLCFEL